MVDSLAIREVWASSHVGLVRSNNEDRIAVQGWKSSADHGNWHGKISASRGWALIADGMGGHDAGEYASEIVVENMLGGIDSANSKEELEALLQQTNERVFRSMLDLRGRPRMGSTIVGIKFCGSHTFFFNIGDSRAYVVAPNGLLQVSKDDTASNLGVRSHALTQSLGGSTKRLPIRPHVMQKGTAFDRPLLLCSDGLSDLLADDEIANIVVRNPNNPADALLAAALDAGGDDNVSVVFIA